MKRVNNLGKAVILLCVLIIGVVIGKITEFKHFEIIKGIDVINVLSLLITVIIAAFFGVFFDKIKGDNRAEKDIILRRVDNIYDITNHLQKESLSGEIPYTDASSSIKRISTSISAIYRTVEKCEFNIKNDIRENIKAAVGDLRDILTDTPRMTEEQIESTDLPIEVKNGVIKFNRQRILQIEAKFDKLKDCLLELEIRINKK